MSDPFSRQQDMIESAVLAIREALAVKIMQCENAAAEAAEDNDDDKPIKASLSITLSWPAGAYPVEIEIKASHSIKRSISFTAKADGNQGSSHSMEVPNEYHHR